jgi:ankyrin repeat protein
MEIMKYKLAKILLLFKIGTTSASHAALTPPMPLILQWLLRNPLTLPNRTERTEEENQLIHAAFTGDIATVVFLLDAGINPNLCPNPTDGETLAMHAVRLKNKLETVRSGLTLELINLLINTQTFDPNLHNANNDTVLHIAIGLGNYEIVRCLLNLPSIDINARGRYGNTVLHLLFQKIVCFPNLGPWGAIIDKILTHPNFSENAENNNAQTARSMLEIMKNNIAQFIAKIDTAEEERPGLSNEERLRDAIMAGDQDAIQDLLLQQPGTNANWRDYNGDRTLLMYAVATGNIEIVQLILTLPDIDLSSTDHEGKTAFSYAEANRNDDIIRALQEAQGELSLKSSEA